MISNKTNNTESCSAVMMILLLAVLLLVENEGVNAFIVMLPLAIPSGAPSSSSSSSRRYQSTSNDNDGSSSNSSSSVGRLESAYKRVNADPPTELASKEPDMIAESIENLVKKQKEEATEYAFNCSLDAWMVASNKSNSKISTTKNKDKGKDDDDNTEISSVLMYGKRMEDVLTMMETNCATGVTIDAYATVIHLYLGGKEPIAALRILGRMENQLQLIQQQQKQESDEFQNIKGRLIQYNRVLQGLVASSLLSLSTAVKLLMSMSLQEEFVYADPIMPYLVNDNGGYIGDDLETFSFLPMNIKPDAKSFATVIVQLIRSISDVNDHYHHQDDRIVQLIRQARRLDQLNNFLIKKINTTILKEIAMAKVECDDNENENDNDNVNEYYDNYAEAKKRIDIALLVDRSAENSLL